jgi:hypothetical protein
MGWRYNAFVQTKGTHKGCRASSEHNIALLNCRINGKTHKSIAQIINGLEAKEDGNRLERNPLD